MMRTRIAAAAALLFGASCPLCAPAAAPADDKPAVKANEETLTGTMWCAKCGLKSAGIKKCTNAIVVTDAGKDVTYFFDDKGSKEEYHEGLCGGESKPGMKVTGVVTEKDGKKWIKPSKVEAKK